METTLEIQKRLELQRDEIAQRYALMLLPNDTLETRTKLLQRACNEYGNLVTREISERLINHTFDTWKRRGKRKKRATQQR